MYIYIYIYHKLYLFLYNLLHTYFFWCAGILECIQQYSRCQQASVTTQLSSDETRKAPNLVGPVVLFIQNENVECLINFFWANKSAKRLLIHLQCFMYLFFFIIGYFYQ